MVSWPELAPQCCDALNYRIFGAACSAGQACWNDLRPLGAIFYYSIPSWLGLPFRSIVVLNLLMVLGSVLLATRALEPLYPGWALRRPVAFLAAAVAHGILMVPDARTSLTDVPAACLALSGVWTFMRSLQKKSGWLLGCSGLFFGMAAFVRAFYLYPVLVVAGAGIALTAASRLLTWKAWATFLMAALVPIFIQFVITYRHTGSFSYLAPVTQEVWTTIHLSSDLYGYDTLLTPGGGAPILYDGQAVGLKIGGLLGAYQSGNWLDLAKLLGLRLNFYFGSFAWRTYLDVREDRVFSLMVWFAHGLLALPTLFLAVTRIRRSIVVVPGLFFAAVFGLGLLVVPETRFYMAAFVATWTIGLAGWVAVGRQWRRGTLGANG